MNIRSFFVGVFAVILLTGQSPPGFSQSTADNNPIFSDTKNHYFSIIRPPGWIQQDYSDARTKVAWMLPGNREVLIRIIAREAGQASYMEMKNEAMAVYRNHVKQGTLLNHRAFETTVGEIKAFAIEGDFQKAGSTRMFFFIADGVSFNCQFAAPSRALFDQHLREAMQAFDTIQCLAGRTADNQKKAAQELSWYKRYAYLLEKMGNLEAAKALIREGLEKFPRDEELRSRARQLR